jgi:hypothetical protein
VDLNLELFFRDLTLFREIQIRADLKKNRSRVAIQGYILISKYPNDDLGSAKIWF